LDTNVSVSVSETKNTADRRVNVVRTGILKIATIASSLVNPRRAHASLIDDLANQ
jgi:hypothetical protein